VSRLLHLSDLHFGAEVPAAVEALVDAAHQLAPDAVLIGGDFTMRARRREWEQAVAFLDRLPQPVLAIPGNHDIPALNQPWGRLFRPFDRYLRTLRGELEPKLVVGGLEVLGLNTSRRFGAPSLDWSRGAVSAAQCLSLPGRFSGETGLRAVIIHHPLLAPPGQRRHLLGGDALLLTALREAAVDLLLAGHFHRSHIGLLSLPPSTESRDIVVSHVSTACSRRTKGEPMGFHAIDAAEDAITVEKYDFVDTASHFREVQRVRFVRTDGGWSTGG
jgi:3',5'-cyclic AMP phosphodiesterase CpdA